MSAINVYSSPMPFSNKQVHACALPGSTVAEIVKNTVPEGYYEAGAGVVAMINGHIVPQEFWSCVKPKEGTLVNIRVVPQGGGGKKSPLALVLSIAIAVAAPYVGAAFGTNLGLSVLGNGVLTAGQTAFFNGIVSGAFSIVAKLAISALAPPPKPRGIGGIASPAESPTLFIEGARNSLSPFGVVPVCLGTNRMVPPQAARPYTETQNNDNYVRQLFSWGVGKVTLADIQIGETSLSEFTDVDIEHLLAGNLSSTSTLFTNDVFQEDYNILLQEVDGFATRTTQLDIDEAIVDITFGQGLVKFNGSGQRTSQTVELEVQYARTGESPQVWSAPSGSYLAVAEQQKTLEAASHTARKITISSQTYYVGYRRDVVVIDKFSGQARVVKGTNIAQTEENAQEDILSNSDIRLSTLQIRFLRNAVTTVETTEVTSYTDDRQPSFFGTTFENSTDFLVSVYGDTVTIAAGGLSDNGLTATAATAEALRKSVKIIFPERGQYDIRARRITGDTDKSEILDKAHLTAIKSVKYQAPVSMPNISGSALRIKATDQLNGAVDQFNAVVSSIVPDYNAEADTWEERITSNPASLYRYILQGAGNSTPLADSKIDLTALQEWHTYCEEQGYTYNRVIDYEASVDDILRDIAAAGAASPTILDGKRSVVIDKPKDDVVQIITPRNSFNYSGDLTYPTLPHAFRVQFRNAEKGYLQDERIVYDDGYDESNATIFESLELQSSTDSNLAFKTARRHLASARLRPEVHTFSMDVENLVAVRGDRIKLYNDVPLVGIGDGRIKSIQYTTDSPALVSGFTIDDTVGIPANETYYVRIRLQDGSQLYKELSTTVGFTSTFTFAVPFSMDDSPAIGDLCAFTQIGQELDLIITSIQFSDDLSATITAVNYAPGVFTAQDAAIPLFQSFVTTPLEFVRPEPPVLTDIQSDESVMLLNSDGSFLPRLVVTLNNGNQGDLQPVVQYRLSGTQTYQSANILEATTNRVVVAGLEDGLLYDIAIRYKRAGTLVLSAPLQINNYKFIGASGLPDDVTGFVINVTGDNALLKWNQNDDIDLSGYKLKFSAAYSGATWATAQTLESLILENRITVPFQGGTYLIKAIDLLGNESETATAIITYDPGALRNVIEVIEEQPDWAGAKDNTVATSGTLVLGETTSLGYYYFDNSLDLGGVFISALSANLVAGGVFINNLFDEVDLFALDDLFGAGGNDLFGISDLFAEEDLFGIGTDSWAVKIEYRTTQGDPTSSPVVWSAWTEFVAGNLEFWAIEFRLVLESLGQNISPQVSSVAITIDMPDRIERGEDLTVPVAGTTITYSPAFKTSPSVNITIQDGAVNDRIEFTSKTASQFSFKVYNETEAGYVERTYDYIVSGYGREN